VTSDAKGGAATLGKYVLASLLLGFFVPRFDDAGLGWLSSGLQPGQVVAFLQAVASGMLAFTGIIFSLLFVMLQFGSTAYSPRIVGVVGRPRMLGRAGGVFIGTFLYALMALRGVGSLRGGATSDLTIGVAFLWLIGSVCMLVRLVASLTGLIQTNVLYLLGDTGQREIARMYAPLGEDGEARVDERARPPPGAPSQVIVHRGSPRYLLGLDVERLVALARAAGAVIHVPSSPGDVIANRAVLALVYGASVAPEAVPEKALRDAIRVGRDRRMEEDPKYAIRLLVDIAVRALAPGLNEPTTAVLALDQIESLLVSLGNAKLDTGEVRDASGALRLVFEAPTWEDYLELAVAEIQHYGGTALQVERRLAELFGFLAEHVPEGRRGGVQRLAQDRLATMRDRFPDASLRVQAGARDRQGIGHASPGARPAPLSS
jgi:uncharacterized membrane protein